MGKVIRNLCKGLVVAGIVLIGTSFISVLIAMPRLAAFQSVLGILLIALGMLGLPRGG
jgi:hypothetical protein